jgi:hypothetical protein
MILPFFNALLAIARHICYYINPYIYMSIKPKNKVMVVLTCAQKKNQNVCSVIESKLYD